MYLNSRTYPVKGFDINGDEFLDLWHYCNYHHRHHHSPDNIMSRILLFLLLADGTCSLLFAIYFPLSHSYVPSSVLETREGPVIYMYILRVPSFSKCHTKGIKEEKGTKNTKCPYLHHRICAVAYD